MTNPTQEAIPQWLLNWRDEWQHKMTCQGVDPRVREGFGKEVPWLYDKICEDFQAKQAQGETVCRWVNVAERLPDYGVDVHIKHADCGFEHGSYGDRDLIEELAEVDKDHPVLWLEEKEAAQAQYTSDNPISAQVVRKDIPEGMDDWCEAHQRYYKDECPDCSDVEQRQLAHDAGMSQADWDKQNKKPHAEDIPVPEDIYLWISENVDNGLNDIQFNPLESNTVYGTAKKNWGSGAIAMYQKMKRKMDAMKEVGAHLICEEAIARARLSSKEQEAADYRKALEVMRDATEAYNPERAFDFIVEILRKYPSPPTK